MHTKSDKTQLLSITYPEMNISPNLILKIMKKIIFRQSNHYYLKELAFKESAYN